MIDGLINIKKAIGSLNPQQVRQMTERPVKIALHAASQDAYQRMEEFFLRDLSPARRGRSALLLTRAPLPSAAPAPDLHIWDGVAAAPTESLLFHPDHEHAFVRTVLSYCDPTVNLALARSFVPFRKPFIGRVIAKTSRENTLFSVSTALPDIVPSIIELPWAVAEFASDTAFLTMNQIRMAFIIAAASDRDVGYAQQKSEIASVIGSAFGWRALAKQLVGKIPLGGGLVAKAAVAYAGTRVLGLSLERYYSIGFTYSREERDKIYTEAFRQGKTVALKMLAYFRPEFAAKR